jgi:hypothetical protein
MNTIRWIVILLLLTVSACKHTTDSESIEEKTRVQFNNQESTQVTIYSDPAHSNLIATVEANESTIIEAAPNAMGAAFYPRYHFLIEGINITYDGGHIVISIEEKKNNLGVIPKLETFETDSVAYIKIKNDGPFSLSFNRGNYELPRLDAGGAIVGSGEYGVYNISPGNASDYSLNKNTSIPISFPAGITEFKNGIIYEFRYDENTLSLISAKSILQKKYPGIPQKFSLVEVRSDGIVLSWDAVYGAISYQIYRATSGSGEFRALEKVTTTSYIDSKELNFSTDYYYKISAASNTNKENEGKLSEAVIARSPASNDIPQNIILTVLSGTSIALSWDAIDGAASYQIYRSTNGSENFPFLATVETASHTDTGLNYFTDYSYKISAMDSIYREGSLSESVTAKTKTNTGISLITIKTFEDVNVSPIQGDSLEIAKGTPITFQVDGTYSKYQWYLNGEALAGDKDNYTLETAELPAGVYELTVLVTTSNNGRRSGSYRFIITN